MTSRKPCSGSGAFVDGGDGFCAGVFVDVGDGVEAAAGVADEAGLGRDVVVAQVVGGGAGPDPGPVGVVAERDAFGVGGVDDVGVLAAGGQDDRCLFEVAQQRFAVFDRDGRALDVRGAGGVEGVEEAGDAQGSGVGLRVPVRPCSRRYSSNIGCVRLLNEVSRAFSSGDSRHRPWSRLFSSMPYIVS